MGLYYLNFCSYWKNLSSPPICCHRGTACQFDMKDHPLTPFVLTDLGTDVVLVTMAARIVQSIISLGRNVLQKRALYWKMLPRACVSKALRAVFWMCRSMVDLFFLPLLMTTVYVYKDRSRFKNMCNTEQPVNTVTIKCHWGSRSEPAKKMLEELHSLKIETIQEVAKMEVDCKCEKMENTEVLVPSCSNPVFLSMICMPSEYVDSSEESEGDSVEGLEGDCSQEEMSVDSGMQESLTPKSKCEEDGGEESDWSDEESWDEESNLSCNEDLWASFCRSDDPYNPLSFAMPTCSPEKPKKDSPTKSLDAHQILEHLGQTIVVKTECGTVTEKYKTRLCKKPVLSAYKSSHNCTLLKEESTQEGDQCTKKVRFSPKVTVHPIITWSFAHRMARKGPWEEYARDRSRFQRRIAETEAAIGFCLDPGHREKIWTRLQSKQN